MLSVMFLFKLFPFIKFGDIDSSVKYVKLDKFNLVTDVKEVILNYRNYEHFIQSFYNFYNDYFDGEYDDYREIVLT